MKVIGNKKVVVGVAGAAAALLLSAGAAFGIQGYNDETSHRCSDAAAAAGQSAAAAAAAQEKAAAARALAAGAGGFDKADGSAEELAGVEAAGADLGTPPSPDCTTREQAAALSTMTQTVASKAAALDDAAVKLNDHAEAFRAAETQRIAAEKKVADEAAAKKKADEEAAAAKKADDEATAQQAQAAAPAAPAPGDGDAPATAKVPAAPAPAPAAPAPAPVRQVPLPAPAAPAPAPAPVAPKAPTGGWTPPPAGQGGFHGCTLLEGRQVCR